MTYFNLPRYMGFIRECKNCGCDGFCDVNPSTTAFSILKDYVRVSHEPYGGSVKTVNFCTLVRTSGTNKVLTYNDKLFIDSRDSIHGDMSSTLDDALLLTAKDTLVMLFPDTPLPKIGVNSLPITQGICVDVHSCVNVITVVVINDSFIEGVTLPRGFELKPILETKGEDTFTKAVIKTLTYTGVMNNAKFPN